VYILTGQAYFSSLPGVDSNITQASYSPEYITPTQQKYAE
jgi:hypothetical protein